MADDKNHATAAAILPLLGGAANITSIAHCMTRLRIGLHDRSLVQGEALRALPVVMGVVEDDTYQIVLGPGIVARVASEFQQLAAEERPAQPTAAHPAAAPEESTAEQLAAQGEVMRSARAAKNGTPFKLFLRRIANIFLPLLPALIGCGVVAGLDGLLAGLHWLPAIAPALDTISGGFMSLIAVFVGYNTAKEFGGTPILGGAVASIVVYAGVAKVSAFGETMVPGQGGVIGALFAALLAVRLEKQCRRWVPEAVDVLVTPTITVLLTGLATMYGLMFVAGHISTGIGTGVTWLLAHGGVFAGMILGGLFLPMVMLGLHQALIPIHTTLIQQQGYTVLLPILAMAGAGQVGCAIAVFLRLKNNHSIRRTIRSALPPGLLGIGEPLIYGVSLPLGRPFITACVGGAFGGAFVGMFNQFGTAVGSSAIGPSAWALIPLLKGNHGFGTTAAIYTGGLLVGYAAGFVATYFFGFTKQMLTELNAEAPVGVAAAEPVAPVGGAVVAPVGGAVVAPVGGAVVAPVGGAVVAPVGGAAVAPTPTTVVTGAPAPGHRAS